MGDRNIFKKNRARPQTATKIRPQTATKIRPQTAFKARPIKEVTPEIIRKLDHEVRIKHDNTKTRSESMINIHSRGMQSFIMPRRSINEESEDWSSRKHSSKPKISLWDEESIKNSIIDSELIHLRRSEVDRFWINKIRTPKLSIQKPVESRNSKIEEIKTPLMKEAVHKLIVPYNQHRKMSIPVMLSNEPSFNQKKDSNYSKKRIFK